MPDEKDKETLNLEELEKGFNEALEDLQKAMKKKVVEEEADEYEDEPEGDEEIPEDEGEEEEEEEPPKRYARKSIPDILSEDPEAAAAMDVEPFLVQFAKAVDERVRAVEKRVESTQELLKSQSKLMVQLAKLQKANQDLIKSIGDTPVPSNSVVRMFKSTKFDQNSPAVSGLEVLAKSREWVRLGKVDLVEAGIIENRINKGLLFKVNDKIDAKVQNLLKEGN